MTFELMHPLDAHGLQKKLHDGLEVCPSHPLGGSFEIQSLAVLNLQVLFDATLSIFRHPLHVLGTQAAERSAKPQETQQSSRDPADAAMDPRSP